jgi:hypothetical protein
LRNVAEFAISRSRCARLSYFESYRRPFCRGFGLDDVSPRAAHPLITRQDARNIGGVAAFKQHRERDAIPDGLIGALAEMREHRVCRVARSASLPFVQHASGWRS